MEAGEDDVFAGEMVEEVEVASVFVVDEDFFPLADIQFFIEVDGVYVSLQQGFEALGGEVEFGHAFGAEQVHFPVLVAGDAQHVVAEQAVGVVLFEFETLDVVTVVAVQSLARTYPYNSPFVNIKAID